MIVVDASCLTDALTDDGPVGTSARFELARDPHWAAPDHLVVEVFSVIRGRWHGRHIREARAEGQWPAAVVDRRPGRDHSAARADAGAAQQRQRLRRRLPRAGRDLRAPLVTADARLGRVPDHRCEVRLALPDEQ